MNKYKNITELIVRLIIKRNDKVLICIGKVTGTHFLPGGHVEFGDTLEKTIYKEMNEELGWGEKDIKKIEFSGYFEHSYTHSVDSELHSELNMIFNVEIADEANVEAKEDHISFEWINIKDINSVNLNPSGIAKFITKQILLDIITL